GALADYARALTIEPRLFLSESSAESTSIILLGRLADLIDGIACSPPTPEAHDPADFHIIVQTAKQVESAPESAAPEPDVAVDVDAEEAAEEMVQDLLAASYNPASGGKKAETLAQASTTFTALADESLRADVPKASLCPVCRRIGTPAETLPDGRTRCG